MFGALSIVNKTIAKKLLTSISAYFWNAPHISVQIKIMKRSIFLYFFFFLFFNNVEGQDITRNWFVQTGFGIEKHDKRLFNVPDKALYIGWNSEAGDWGTYHYNVSIFRKIKQLKRFSFYTGIGISYEKATYLRPFDHSYFNKRDKLFRILRVQNKYEKIKIPLSLNLFYEIADNLFFDVELSSLFLVYRSIDHTENNSDFFPYTESTFELDAINLDTGINYRINHFIFGINTRIFNHQKIDKIIFGAVVRDPRVNQKWEIYNPLQLNFNVGYMW